MTMKLTITIKNFSKHLKFSQNGKQIVSKWQTYLVNHTGADMFQELHAVLLHSNNGYLVTDVFVHNSHLQVLWITSDADTEQDHLNSGNSKLKYHRSRKKQSGQIDIKVYLRFVSKVIYRIIIYIRLFGEAKNLCI